MLRALRALGTLLAAAALFFLASGPGTAALASGPGGASRACNVHLRGDKLTAPRGGGAATQTYTVNNDCSISKAPVRILRAGTPEFQTFLQEKRARAASVANTIIDPSCDSELDYQDVINANLTFTQVQQGYAYDPGAGQVVSLGGYYSHPAAAVDGWYFIRDSQGPWGGPIPYGTVTVSYYAEFAWVDGSFWHSHKNNNQFDGFGQCSGWPEENGSTVPGGHWTWGVWQS